MPNPQYLSVKMAVCRQGKLYKDYTTIPCLLHNVVFSLQSMKKDVTYRKV